MNSKAEFLHGITHPDIAIIFCLSSLAPQTNQINQTNHQISYEEVYHLLISHAA